MMKLPIKISLRHRGKALGLDSEAETMTLLDPTGEPLGAVSWEAVIDFIQGYVKEARSHRAVRNYPRSRLAAKVRYLTGDHTHVDRCHLRDRRRWGLHRDPSAAAARDGPRAGTRHA